MDLTVCICTRDRPAYLQDCLRGLQRQTVGDRFDILVVDSASHASNAADLTRIVADILPHARLQRVEQPGISLARNIGAQALRAAVTSPTSTMTPFLRPIGSSASPPRSPRETHRRR
jgi:glucosyl-dolichyl phosphate glucuronosyltransferase